MTSHSEATPWPRILSAISSGDPLASPSASTRRSVASSSTAARKSKPPSASATPTPPSGNSSTTSAAPAGPASRPPFCPGRPPAAAGQPLTPATADARLLELAPGRRLRTRLAGLFLFLPLLARLDLPQLLAHAAYPGSDRIPATSALLSLLALKLVDKERRSHSDDLNCAEAAGLFAGLNVLPKKSFLAEYSYRCDRPPQRALLAGWVAGLSGLLFAQAQ